MTVKLKPEALRQGLLMLAPASMAFARRSSVLLLAATALAILVSDRKNFGERWRAMRIDRALLAGLAMLIAYAAVSLAWSPLPGRGLKQLLFDFALPLAAGLIVLTGAGSAVSDRTRRWFTLAIALAGALVTAQILFQIRLEALFSAHGQNGEIWRFNMVVVTLGLMLPALLMIARRQPLWAALSLAALVAASALSQSATSKMLLITGVLAYLAASILPRRVTLALSGLALFGILALQPWQGDIVEHAFRSAGKSEILFQSAQERIVIWKATGTMALHALPWGTGMGSSDAVSETAFAKTLTPEIWVGLRQTHAHDAFLNVLMELGLPGLIGMGLIAFGLLRTLARLPHPLFAPSIALAVQVVTVDLISHGAWQAWWLTAIMLGILALKQYEPAPDLRD